MPDWTPEQRAALENRGANLLVSASAGTGKTTVLVERIIRLVLDPDAPVDLDRFLVVTFTEAAASEMREKIATALRKRLGDHPGDEGLRRQTLLLDHAQISTIHSFCNRVLRQHFHVVGLDPEFTILDAEETRLVQAETADILLKEEVEKAGQELEEGPSTGRGKVLLDWLDSFRAADPIPPARDRLLRLYAFLRTLDDPTGWIHSVREAYPLDDDGQGIAALDETCEWFRAWRSELIGALENLAEQAGNLEVETARVQPKYSPWIAAYVELAEDCAEALEQEDWNEAARLLQNFSAPRMAAIRGKDPATEALQLRLYPLKELVEKTLKKDLASLRPEQAARAHADAAPSVHILLDLLESFDRLYGKAKTIRTGLDYNDLEQFCLSILRDPESPAQPSDAARAYQERFEHVLVDEYQDINHVQDAIISLVSRSLDRERPSNLFAVGDVKQSIYGFRLAAPEIFLEKYDSYRPFSAPSQPEALNDRSVRIDLTHNFRSRVEVLDTVNYFFERLMTRDSAKLDYNEDAALRPKAVFPELRSKPVPEFHLLDTKAETGDEEDAPAETDESLEPTRVEGEAMMVGRLILEAVGRNSPPGGQSVYDSALAEATRTDGLRPARFRDVVVLMRSLSSAAETYVATFNRLGIPVFVDYGAGLLATAEIRDVLNFLRLVDNPLQDVPLAAVLRSPLENWSETEMAEVRMADRRAPFHEAFRLAGEPDSTCPPEVRRKTAGFLRRLETWRTRARRETLADLISALYDETGYPTWVLGLHGGETRRANLLALYRIACQFDRFSRPGLSRFLRFVEQLQRESGDYGAASPLGESQDVVRIMSIHKSKGLEFPIVFLSGLGKRFNLQDLTDPVLCSRSGGMGIQVTDVSRRVGYPTPILNLLKRRKREEDLAEELRLLYVGMTRARERLVLTATIEKLDEKVEKAISSAGTAPLPKANFISASTPLDWLLPAAGNLLERKSNSGLLHYFPHKIDELNPADSTGQGAPSEAGEAIPAEPGPDDSREIEKTLERIRWRYPHLVLTRQAARVSASELKRRWTAQTEPGERVQPLPYLRQAGKSCRFEPPTLEKPARPDSSTAIERGLCTHLVLQHLDFTTDCDYAGLSAQVDRMIDRGLLIEERRDLVDLKAIARFLDSQLGRRLLAVPPDQVWREASFILGLSPSEAGLPELADYDAGERIRAQGVIDCLFEQDSGLILIDYKTDAVPPEAAPQRAQFYLPQMRIYEKAIEAIFGRSVSESWICFLTPGIWVPTSPFEGLSPSL